MATRVCPECGTQYVASVRRCIDCDAMLVDEVGPEGEAVPPAAKQMAEGPQIPSVCTARGNTMRATLTDIVDLQALPKG